jgi:hypothetical protein
MTTDYQTKGLKFSAIGNVAGGLLLCTGEIFRPFCLEKGGIIMKLDEAYDVVIDCRRKMPTLRALANSIVNCADELDFDYHDVFLGLMAMFKEFHEQLMGVEGAIYDSLVSADEKSEKTDLKVVAGE